MRSIPAPAPLVLTLSFLALLLIPATQAQAVPDLVQTLPNKVTVVVREVHTRPIVSIQAWVRAGTRDEALKDRGLALLTAQCILDATTKREPGKIQKEVYGMAGSFASEVGYDYSVFDLTVPSRSFATGLGLMSEGLAQARIDQGVVGSAVGRAQGLSRTVLTEASHAAVNPVRARLHEGSPLGSPLAIPLQEFNPLTATLIQRFYRDHYVAENLTVVVAGDVDAQEVVEKVSAAFAEMPRGKAPSRPRFTEKAFSGTQVAIQKNYPDTYGTGIAVGFRSPAWGSADALAMDALLAVLVDNPLSRTQSRLNAGNAEFMRAEAIPGYEPEGGTVALAFVVDPDSVEDAEGAILTLLEQARSSPVTSEEFQSAIRTLTQRDAFGRSEVSGMGRRTALAYLRGVPGSEDVYLQRVKALRPEDLVAVARKYLDMSKAVFVEMGSDSIISRFKGADALGRRIREKQSVYGAAYRSGPQATASQDAERQQRLDAPLKQAASLKPVDAGRGRVVRTVLPGGIRLLVSEDHSAPSATVAVYLLGGVRYENDNNNGITSLLRETILNSIDPGTRGLTYRQTLQLDGRLVSYQDKDMWGCAIALPSDGWQQALGRMGSMFSHPDLDTVNVDATRIMVLETLDRWRRDDQAQRDRLIFPTKYLVSGYRLPQLGSHRTLASTPHAEIVSWYRKFVVQPNMVIAVFGDVNAAAVQAEVARAFGGVSTKPFQPGTVAQEGEFDGFREQWELGTGLFSTVTIAFSGPPARSPDIAPLYVVASLLGGPKGWLEQYVMTTGGAKGANAILSQALDESPLLTTVTVTGPMQEEDMVKLLFRQIKKAALLPLRGDMAPELVNAKMYASGSYYMALDSNPTRAHQFARAELFGLGIDYPILLPARIDGVTSDDLLRIGQKYFQRGQWDKAPYAVAETRPGGW
jgi:zinc protease